MTAEIIKEQFTAAYAGMVDSIFRYFLFRIRGREDSMELTQETFMRVWKHLADGNQGVENLKSYIYKTAHNLVVDYSKKKKTISLDEMLENGFQAADEKTEIKEDIINSANLLKEIEGLEKDYREILLLRYMDELSVKEIAKYLGITETLASVRIYRALKQIKQKL